MPLALDPSKLVYVSALLTLGVVCMIAILNEAYDDTFLQRCSLSIVVLGALGEMNAACLSEHSGNSRLTLIVGVALYAVSTLMKRRRLSRGTEHVA